MLKGKYAIVTGSTSGIGLGAGRTLRQRGRRRCLINGFGDAGEIEALRPAWPRSSASRSPFSSTDMSSRRRSR